MRRITIEAVHIKVRISQKRSIIRQNQIPAFASACPYVLAYVDLEEGPRLLTNLVGCEPDSVAVGMPVQVEFVDTGEFAVPRFRPA